MSEGAAPHSPSGRGGPGLGSRDRALERLAAGPAREPFDLLIVGGGITGAGIALDASSRGMSVALVERDDFASGTSSKSSKLVHGGLRYLEQREFGLVREAATERDLLRRLAPHLVEPIPFVLPVSGRLIRAKFRAGLWAYDALATFKTLKVHRSLNAEETREALPVLPEGKAGGGFEYFDCKTDDVRLVMEILLAAVRRGAIAANYLKAIDLSGSGEECAATVEDGLTGYTLEIRSRRVIVAAGVWNDELERMAEPDAPHRIRPSKGVHLVFSRKDLPMAEAAALIPDADHKRMLFVIPWHDAVLVGTTDTAYSGDLDSPSVEPSDRSYCLDAVNQMFDLSLTEEDIQGAYAGLRPLIAGRAGETADLSRKHQVYELSPGILGITGGKLTTWRRMARDAVDVIAEALPWEGGRSQTKNIRLGSSDVEALTVAVDRRASKIGVDREAARNLMRTYGDRALLVLDESEADLTEPLAPGHPSLAAEAVYCARFEMVVHLSDLLSRRTRLALTDRAGGAGAGSVAVKLLAAELGWDDDRSRAELDEHRTRLAAERGMEVPEPVAGP